MPVSDYTPDVEEVAAFIRARTKTQGGKEAGTFNPAVSWTDGSGDGTRPTSEQVATEIGNALPKITGVVGADIPDAPGSDPNAYREAAKRVAALRTAAIIELSYWPEQVNTGRSTYPQLKDMLDEEWKQLLADMGIGTEAGGGAVPASAGYPSYGGFPETAIGMEFAW
jgi:hypothetical protein